jgi:hypothetical protein
VDEAHEISITWDGIPQRLKSLAEKLGSATSGAKACPERKRAIAALEALRHPKTNFD